MPVSENEDVPEPARDTADRDASHAGVDGPRAGTLGAAPAVADAVRGGGPAAAADSVLSVVAGAGPVGRPGERATVRLRDGGDPAPDPAPGSDEPPRYAPEWLQLREPADTAARAQDLLDPLRIRLANMPGRTGGLAVHDLGCGTGSMGRWLAPRLDGAQHWVLHDRDPYLLHFAAVASPRSAADGSRVTVETRRGDVARLTADALRGASLVTASALLDVLTREEVGTLVDACTGAGCPALLTLSVAGHVELTPADPLDAEIAEAFNDHQRRTGLLGPDAVTAACEAFAARGATVRVHPSPWRLGPEQAALSEQWLRGWVGAAVEQRPELRERAARYLRDRLAACAAGELRVVVHHSDLLALPRPTGGTP
ncbi:trans-aconitate methyltransferase [Streptomyces sp. FXJ1.172]|uniref:trans-aconitate methyltransferase n=1 Tax=Streptomyces sp. FXJ1.172 TaxID=710705 RepID=UPI003FA6890A